MVKPAEIDPLLPQNDPSPEISGYGSSRPTYGSSIKDSAPEYLTVEQVDENASPAEVTTATRSSPWGTFISIFSFVVLFCFVIAALRPHSGWDNLDPIPGDSRPGRTRPNATLTIEQRVTKILTETPLIDGHDDFAIFVRYAYQNKIDTEEFKDKFENGGMALNVDLPRLRKGMVGGAFWSSFVGCPNNASEDFSDAEYATAVSETLQQIDLIKRVQAQYPGEFTPAGTSIANMLKQFHATRSMFGQISIEGLHQLPQSAAMATLRLYYSLGVRAATLTWNCHNAFADAALITSNGKTTLAPYHRGGLTPAGRGVIQEMNRLGMLLDISHTSYWTQKAVMSNGTSRAPVVFTHSSAFSICGHPRNVKDDILDLVKETGSIVMVNFSPDFISCKGDGDIPPFYEKNNTLHQVARHITYIGDRIGYDHVGLGSDFDGIGQLTPVGLEGVDKFPDLIAELLRMGISDADAAKVVGGNILRVWQKAEEVAEKMQKEGVEPGVDSFSKPSMADVL